MDHLIKFVPGDIIISKTDKIVYLVDEVTLMYSRIKYKLIYFGYSESGYLPGMTHGLREIYIDEDDCGDYELIRSLSLPYNRWSDWLCHDHKCPVCEFLGCNECAWKTKESFPFLPGDLVWVPKRKRKDKVSSIFLNFPPNSSFRSKLYDILTYYVYTEGSLDIEVGITAILDSDSRVIVEENKGKVKRIGRTYHLMPDHKHLDGICDMCAINNCENCRIDEIRTKYRITRKSTGTEENGF